MKRRVNVFVVQRSSDLRTAMDDYIARNIRTTFPNDKLRKFPRRSARSLESLALYPPPGQSKFSAYCPELPLFG